MMAQANPIVHLVFWKLNGNTVEVTKTQANKIIEAFQAMKNEIEGLLKLEVGQNCIDHPDAWDVSVYMVFKAVAFLESYQTHPMHLDIKRLVGPMRLDRGQLDFEIDLDETPSLKEAI